jgi:drug/metabolite transporter (DMT)-like permease
MPAGSNKSMGAMEWLLLITLSVLWGGSFFFGRVALAELPPFTVVLARVGIAAAALHVVLIARGGRMPRSLQLWGALLVMGLLNNMIPFSLIFWGQTQISSSLASILNATTPLFTACIAHVLTRDERLTANRLSGVALGLAGVAIMIGPEVLAGLGANVFAQLAILGAAISCGFAGIFGRRFSGLSPLETATGQLTCSTLIILPVALAYDQPWALPAPGMTTWAAVVSIALLSTALAYIVFFRILAASGATNVMLVTLLIPAVAVLLGVMLLDEQLSLSQAAGMVVIASGLAAIDGRPLIYLRRLFWREHSTQNS